MGILSGFQIVWAWGEVLNFSLYPNRTGKVYSTVEYT